MNYGKALKKIRIELGLTQGELAAKAQLKQSHISLLETNARQPSLNALDTIASALNVPVYLISLMAADAEDLRGITLEEADLLGQKLLAVCMAATGRGADNEPTLVEKTGSHSRD